jgi:general secretion pathway protein F
VGDDRLARYCLQLAWLLESGLPGVACCRYLARDAPSEQLRMASGRAARQLRAGVPLGRALAHCGAFPRMFRGLITAADEVGRLPAALERLSEALSRRAAARRRLRTALLTPLPAVLASAAVAVLLITRVLPAVEQAFSGAGLPGLPMIRSLLAFAEASGSVSRTVLPTGLIVAAVALLAWDARQLDTHRALIRCPLVGPVIVLGNSARYTMALGWLLGAGLPVLRALRLAADVPSNVYLAWRLGWTARFVRGGATVAQALAMSRALPPFAVRLAATGERTGTLPDALERAAGAAESALEHRLNRLARVLEPLTLGLVGLAIALLGLTILEPLRAVLRWSSAL